MSRFRTALQDRATNPAGRRWLFVPYDQLHDGIGPLSREDPRELGIVVVEAPWKAARRPYHKQKLALVIANLRHFALEQAARGVAVRHMVSDGPYRDALEIAARELGPIRVMRPAERELRVDLQPLVESGALEVIPHEGWLTTPELFRKSHANGPPWLMERFYRLARTTSGLLMENGKPVGGKYNFDAENRNPWRKGDPEPPRFPAFPSDPVKDEAVELIATRYAHHPGQLTPNALPATLADAEALWAWAKQACLPNFGRFEDAMSERSPGLFHTRISPLLNIHRLLPARIVQEAAALEHVPLASREGFVRQILGWREFMRHVHEETDGFRKLPGTNAVPLRESDGASNASALGSDAPLPPAFWGTAKSGMNCLDTVVTDVWRDGWSHHITRLMILSNLATLLDVSPRELTDWFWVAYIDAYDWVVEPNVMGMGTYGIGGLFTTKPYVSGANYIRRMSDYCDGCQFEPGSTCPFGPLYWAFLDRHRDALERNPRMAMPYRTLRQRMQSGQGPNQDQFIQIRDTLERGEMLTLRTGSRAGSLPLL